MFDHRLILPDWVLAISVFALIGLVGATSVDFLLTSGFQWGADPGPVQQVRPAGTW